MDYSSFTIKFPNGCKALAVRSDISADIFAIVKALQLSPPKGLLALSGGAGGMEENIAARLRPLFQMIARIAKEKELMIIDGGTQSGIMALMGEALFENGASNTHIGVLPAKVETGSGGKLAEEIMEPHHTHFVLVNSNKWGGEVPTMYKLINHFSQNIPSAILLINGGAISLLEIQHAVQQGHPVVVFAGSGRLADEIVQAIQKPALPVRPEIASLLRKGQFIIFDISQSPAKLKHLLVK